MTFYILRHGDKEAGDFRNPNVPMNDQPISALGHEQARALWEFFAGKEIAQIYVSAYRRTGETIAYVAEQFGLTPVMDERLNEINIGGFRRGHARGITGKVPGRVAGLSRETKRFPFSKW